MRALAISILAALVAAAAAPAAQLPPAAPAGQLVFYGHIKSLTPSGSRYVLRFDPAWLLEGTTASRPRSRTARSRRASRCRTTTTRATRATSCSRSSSRGRPASPC